MVNSVTLIMKKYTSLGVLLRDYRKYYDISQHNFAANLNLDIRTIQRWESGHTLIKPEKEEEIVLETHLPYQLIHNLNASVPIETFYDFTIRKYSLSFLTNDLPEASWLKKDISNHSKRVVTIREEYDIDQILRDIEFHDHTPNVVQKELIIEAIRILPELNLIVKDDSGYYAGHSITFPINTNTFEKLKNQEIGEQEIKISDLIDYKRVEKPVFYSYDITSDCNDNFFHLAHRYLTFFDAIQETNYTFCSFTIRYDSYTINEQLGLDLIWKNIDEQKKRGLNAAPRFYVGDFKGFLMERI